MIDHPNGSSSDERREVPEPASRVPRRVLLGVVWFTPLSFEHAVDRVIAAAEKARGLSVRLSNAWCVVVAEDHPAYADILNGPGITLADGFPVARYLKRQVSQAERVRGPSFFDAVLNRTESLPIRHFFLGGSPRTLASLQNKVIAKYPGITIAGSWSPPFQPFSQQLVAHAVHEIAPTDADIVWIGLGTPKQDYLSAELSERLGIPCVGVGAAFDFAAGTVREAPAFVQRVGFEWLYRLVSEPRRLWRRYLIGNVRFLALMFGQILLESRRSRSKNSARKGGAGAYRDGS